jgi:hypothetical protein
MLDHVHESGTREKNEKGLKRRLLSIQAFRPDNESLQWVFKGISSQNYLSSLGSTSMKPKQSLSRIQRLALWLLPKRWSDSLEAESRQWLAECPCGHACSVWELGGIRWKAAGQPRKMIRCPKCGQFRLHKIVWRGS